MVYGIDLQGWGQAGNLKWCALGQEVCGMLCATLRQEEALTQISKGGAYKPELARARGAHALPSITS